MPTTTVTLTNEELETAISGLLFSCSVNIVSETNLECQQRILNLAKRLKNLVPDIKLNSVCFLKEESYEDESSADILEEFKNNLEITTFEHVWVTHLQK